MGTTDRPHCGPRTARSSGCVWAGTSGLPSWTAGCLAPLASLLGTAGVENYSPDTQHRFPEVLRGLDGHREGGLACSGLHTACCASPSFPNRGRTATELQQPGPDPHCHRPAWRLLRAGPNPGAGRSVLPPTAHSHAEKQPGMAVFTHAEAQGRLAMWQEAMGPGQWSPTFLAPGTGAPLRGGAGAGGGCRCRWSSAHLPVLTSRGAAGA